MSKSENFKKWYYNNREECKAKSRERYARRRDAARKRAKERQTEIRLLVISHYGGLCACCGESRYEFLAIDHKYGGGNKHAKEAGKGTHLTRWIVRNDFPPIFQILCHNCNMARGFYGFCPHQKERGDVALAS